MVFSKVFQNFLKVSITWNNTSHALLKRSQAVSEYHAISSCLLLQTHLSALQDATQTCVKYTHAPLYLASPASSQFNYDFISSFPHLCSPRLFPWCVRVWRAWEETIASAGRLPYSDWSLFTPALHSIHARGYNTHTHTNTCTLR